MSFRALGMAGLALALVVAAAAPATAGGATVRFESPALDGNRLIAAAPEIDLVATASPASAAEADQIRTFEVFLQDRSLGKRKPEAPSADGVERIELKGLKLPAAEGFLTAVVLTRGGEITAQHLPYVLDTEPPFVWIDGLAPDQVLKVRSLAASGLAVDKSLARVVATVGLHVAAPVLSERNTAWSAAFSDLPDGAHILRVTANDATGKSAAREVRFFVDATPPRFDESTLTVNGVSLASAAAMPTLDASTLTIAGTIREACPLDRTSHQVTVNGYPATIAPLGPGKQRFSAQLAAPRGPLTLTIACRDVAGATAQIQRRLLIAAPRSTNHSGQLVGPERYHATSDAQGSARPSPAPPDARSENSPESHALRAARAQRGIGE